jgi:hypothetical protein
MSRVRCEIGLLRATQMCLNQIALEATSYTRHACGRG